VRDKVLGSLLVSSAEHKKTKKSADSLLRINMAVNPPSQSRLTSTNPRWTTLTPFNRFHTFSSSTPLGDDDEAPNGFNLERPHQRGAVMSLEVSEGG
jgi:hypothetical protein